MAEIIDENRVKYVVNFLQHQRNNAQNSLVDSLVEQQVLKDEIVQLKAAIFKLQQETTALKEVIFDLENRSASHV